jgi:hypothetical protein
MEGACSSDMVTDGLPAKSLDTSEAAERRRGDRFSKLHRRQAGASLEEGTLAEAS